MAYFTSAETTSQHAFSVLDLAKPLDVLTQQLEHNTALTNLATEVSSDHFSIHWIGRTNELEDSSLLKSNRNFQTTSHYRTHNKDVLTGVEHKTSLITHLDDRLTQNRQALSQRSRMRQVQEPGNTQANARMIGNLDDWQTLNGQVNRRDRNDYFCFNLANKSNFSLTLNKLQADADVQLLNAAGRVIQSSVQSGKNAESIQFNLEAGTYYARVYAYGDASTRYSLNLGANPIVSSSQKKNWTVMVYMAADTLEEFSLQDFQEMAEIGANSNVNVVVQLDRTAGGDTSFGNWTGTRRGLVDQGDTPGLNWGTGIGEVNMGSAKTLWDFVNWGMTNYQADHYALINWGHGSGFNVSYDDQTRDSISASELNTVLANLPTPIDLVGADACLMGMAEFAYEIRNHASVFVGSQELEPGTGWDYTQLLSDLATTPTMNASQLGSAIVNGYASYYNRPLAN